LYKPYEPLLNRMRDLNLKIYGVVDVFDAAGSHAAADKHHASDDASSSLAVRNP